MSQKLDRGFEMGTNKENNFSGKVLVIDDEPAIRKTLKGILKRKNYYVDTANDYGEIKDKLFNENYDALILDIILPDVDGIEILHNINKADLNLPTIMLTGAPSMETAKESVKYGAFDYLTKPVDSLLLLNQLKNAITKKRLIDSRNNLLNKLQDKKEELEKLVEMRTEELKISEIRNRTIVEAVHDMIIITDPKGIIKFTNVMFLDEISDATGEDLHFADIIEKNVNTFIDSLHDMKLETVISKAADGNEFDFIKLNFLSKFNMKQEFHAALRGIFNEDLELQEIIFIIGKK